MSLDAGHIAVDLRDGVSVRSTRPTNLGAVFRGKSPAAVRAMVPLLFTVCGEAQLAACNLAISAAEGRAPEKDSAADRVRLEAVREHLMRIATGWRRELGEEPDVAMLRRIHGLAVLARKDPAAAHAEALRLVAELAGPLPLLASGDMKFIDEAPTAAARLLRHVRGHHWETLGACGKAPAPGESSCLTLVWDDPRLAEARRSCGPGLFTRLLARLVHVARLLGPEPLPGNAMQVETARGLLSHAAVMEGALIASYEISAPTDINFAPDGPAALSLAALRRQSHNGSESPARLLVEAFDPCVAYSLRVR